MTRRATTRATLAIALSGALVLAACGDDDTDEDADAAPADQTVGTEGVAPAGEGGGDGDGEATEGGSFTLYSGRDEELVQPLIDQFEEETGIEVDVRYGNSAEMGAQILEEGESTPAEVFFSQEVGAVGLLQDNELLSPLPAELVESVDERFRPADGESWVGVTGRARVIVYNPELVQDVPEGVLELTDPQYAGQVAWVPGNAGFQAFVSGFRVSAGEDAARQWLEAMQANEPQAFEGNNDVLEAVNAGEVPMGLINHYYWARSIPELGDELVAELVFPAGDDPGGLVNATAAGVTVTGADNPAALAFVEYLVSEAGQQYFVDETFEYPLIDGIDDPEGIPGLDELGGPDLDLSDLQSLEATQTLLTDLGLLS